MTGSDATFESRGKAMSKRNSGLQPLLLVVIVTLIGGGLWMALAKGAWLHAKDPEVMRGALVQRGPLRISVTERGNLKAADSVSLKSEIEGQSTILKLIPEGTVVEQGALLCELDATQQIDQRVRQPGIR